MTQTPSQNYLTAPEPPAAPFSHLCHAAPGPPSPPHSCRVPGEVPSGWGRGPFHKGLCLDFFPGSRAQVNGPESRKLGPDRSRHLATGLDVGLRARSPSPVTGRLPDTRSHPGPERQVPPLREVRAVVSWRFHCGPGSRFRSRVESSLRA